MVKFIVKCMLPISIVEKDGFRELMHYLEPSYRIPTRNKLRGTDLPSMKTTIENKIKLELKQFDSLNVSLDGWSDAILRSFNGFIVQGNFSKQLFISNHFK